MSERKIPKVQAFVRRWLFGKKTTASFASMPSAAELRSMLDQTDERELDCAEAYGLIDQYAEIVRDGKDPGALLPQVKRHLELCRECREELEALLIAIEATSRPVTAER